MLHLMPFDPIPIHSQTKRRWKISSVIRCEMHNSFNRHNQQYLCERLQLLWMTFLWVGLYYIVYKYIYLSFCMPVLLEINVLIRDDAHFEAVLLWFVMCTEWMQLCSLFIHKKAVVLHYAGVTEACLLLLGNMDYCSICEKTSEFGDAPICTFWSYW